MVVFRQIMLKRRTKYFICATYSYSTSL